MQNQGLPRPRERGQLPPPDSLGWPRQSQESLWSCVSPLESLPEQRQRLRVPALSRYGSSSARQDTSVETETWSAQPAELSGAFSEFLESLELEGPGRPHAKRS